VSQLTRYGFSREAGRQHVPVPLVRRPVMHAMRIDRGWWPGLEQALPLPEPDPELSDIAELVDAVVEDYARAVVLPAPTADMGQCGHSFPDWPDAPLPEELDDEEDHGMPQGDIPTADDGSGREGLAPEGSSEAPGDDGQETLANAEQSRTDHDPAISSGAADIPFTGDEKVTATPAPSAPAQGADGEPNKLGAVAEAVEDRPAPTNAARGRYAPATDDVGGGRATLQSGSRARNARSRTARPAPTDQTMAAPPRLFVPPTERIDLSAVRSRMDQGAELAAATRIAAAAERAAAQADEGMVACRCGTRGMGAATGLVPAWFGRDCIEKDCSLRGTV
jgi:hypothetical protein